MTSFLSAIAASVPTLSFSAQPAQAAWNSVVGVGGPASGGTLNSYVDEWVLTIARKVGPYWTASGQQNPYIIARSELTASLSLKFNPVPNESQLLNYLNNSQPQVQIIATGPNSSSVTNDSREAFGYDVTAKCIANTTNVGFSAAYCPVKVTVKNAIPSY